jgi:hypothetical protein
MLFFLLIVLEHKLYRAVVYSHADLSYFGQPDNVTRVTSAKLCNECVGVDN